MVDANGIAEGLGLGSRISMVLQAAFFKLAGILPEAEAMEQMKEAARKSFQKKGDTGPSTASKYSNFFIFERYFNSICLIRSISTSIIMFMVFNSIIALLLQNPA